MNPTIQQLCEAMAWTTEHMLLPEIQSTYARIQAREVAKLLRWLGSVTDERRDLARNRSAVLRRGLAPLAARLRALANSEARRLASEIDAHLGVSPDETALATDAETSRRMQARVIALLPALGRVEANALAVDLHAAIAEDIGAELSAGLPPSSFEELTRADLASGARDGPREKDNDSR